MADSTVDGWGDGLADVVVVGAGLSGLVCARELTRQGLAVQVLEARDSAGGRMRGHSSGLGLRVDLGGQWVGATHQRLLALLEEFGLRRFPTYYDGEGVFHWNGAAQRAGVEHDFSSSLLFFRPGELALPPFEVAATLELQRRFQELVARVPPRAPWTAPDAEELDRLSIAGWLERQGAGELARYPFAWLTRIGGSGGFEPHESSLLHLAWTQAVAPQQETPEAWLVEGGAAQLADRLAAELGEALRLRAPVRAIEQRGNSVCITQGASEAVRAAAAVVAIPPPMRLGIQFDPCLPPEWLGLLQRSPMSSPLTAPHLAGQASWPASSPGSAPCAGSAWARRSAAGPFCRTWCAGGEPRRPSPPIWCFTTGMPRAGAAVPSPLS
jgi:monoamine oxidase